MILKSSVVSESKGLVIRKENHNDGVYQRDTWVNWKSFPWPKMDKNEQENRIRLWSSAKNECSWVYIDINKWLNKSTNCGENINIYIKNININFIFIKYKNINGRIPNNLCRYFVLKGVKHNSPLLKCGLFREKHSIVKKGEKEHRIKSQEKLTAWWRSLINTISDRWAGLTSEVINHIDSIYPWNDVMKMTLYLWGLPFIKPQLHLIMRKKHQTSE